ncbi:schwannomin-interacting protein 1 homolog isoform X2 [Drosophila tropicalis]|uniref:schwannomin-interacting protein 1 homolog isoform X2 n=1 Tax=Drosophila tropicalis TaxID=46794 RepID=UPI0035AB9D2E
MFLLMKRPNFWGIYSIIIGNFGKVVDREFDLLVPGYKKMETPNGLEAIHPLKMLDADLSNATESIKVKALKLFDAFKYQKHKIIILGQQNKIKKPKYKKESYDDRELPPVAFEYKQWRNSLQTGTKCEKEEYYVGNLKQQNLSSFITTKCKKNDGQSKQHMNIKEKYGTLDESPEITEKEKPVENNKFSRNSFNIQPSHWAHYLKKRGKNNKDVSSSAILDLKANEYASDTESYSSDSETCPKLSKQTQSCKNLLHCAQSFISIGQSCNGKHNNFQNNWTEKRSLETNILQNVGSKREGKTLLEHPLPIVDVIRTMAKDVGINMGSYNLWISRQLLTGANTIHLQLLINTLEAYIENLNYILVDNLKERDDLNINQNELLVELEKITNFM